MTKDELLAELLLERYTPPSLPPAVPPHPVAAALAARAPVDEPEPTSVRRRGHLRVIDGGPMPHGDGATAPPAQQRTIGVPMLISLDPEQVQLLVAVDQGRVHSDPRFVQPDFETEPGPPAMTKRATRRLAPLKKARLVELDPDTEPDRYGVRPYRPTELGSRVLAEVRAQEAAAQTDQTTGAA
jgi:hypothetical protein